MGNEPLWREAEPADQVAAKRGASTAAPSNEPGPLINLRRRLRHLIDAKKGAGRGEAGGDAIAWGASGLWAGCAAWFALPTPPGEIAGWILVGLALITALPAIFRGRRALLPIAGFLLGLALVTREVAVHRVTVLPASTGRVEMTGVVTRVDTSSAGRPRLVLRVTSLPAVVPRHRPERVRITLLGRIAGEALPLPGDGLRLTVRLRRPPGPAEPGAYDPARTLWFEGIGAVGHAFVRDLRPLDEGCAKGCGWRLRLSRYLERLRRHIARSLAEHIGNEDARALARVLLTGARNALSGSVRDDLRAAGLAHILAISGLHLALVAGAVFWVVRAGLALFPILALHMPLRRIAATSSLIAALAYMLLSGNSVATQRAFLMLTVMYLAVLLERRAITMRNLGLAAGFVLFLAPHVAVTAGFQMSFLAVMGLIAVWEVWQTREMRRETAGGALRDDARVSLRLLRRAAAGVGALIVSSVVAAAMTATPSIWHFQRLAPWGLLGNLLALPTLSLLVMPAGLVALAVMPLGLEGLVLRLMEEGLAFILWWSHHVAALPGALQVVAVPTLPALLLATAGVVILGLRRDVLRLLGIPPIVLACLWPPAPRPDLLVDDRARLVAVRDATGHLVPLPGRAGNFALSVWLRRDGDPVPPTGARRRAGWRCAEGVCDYRLKELKVRYLSGRLEKMRRGRLACDGADVVIAAFPLRGACRGARVRIDRFSVWRDGAHALFLPSAASGNRLVVRRALDPHLLPWHPKPLPRRKVVRRVMNSPP